MSALTTLLQADPARVESFSIEQVVSLCGTGKLTDNSDCSRELREYFRIAKSEVLFGYLQSCLSRNFDKSGFVLQDIVNELGRRLDYSVENGLYQGRSNAIGFDGLWADGDGHTIVAEVKTTDAYRINLDVVGGYREALISTGKIKKESSSLIVVGRQDTGDLEAQVRGSRHAWTTRIISADALVKLVSLKESTELNSVSKIHELLIPFEYTRLDQIIEIAFTVAEDASSALQEDQGVEPTTVEDVDAPAEERRQQHTSQAVIDGVRAQVVAALVRKHGALVKKSRALYWSADKSVRTAVTVSKRYGEEGYWFAYHSGWDQFLSEASQGFFVLGCIGLDEAFALPYSWIHARLEQLNFTERNGEKHWHIVLYPAGEGQFTLRLRNHQNEFLSEFALKVGEMELSKGVSR